MVGCFGAARSFVWTEAWALCATSLARLAHDTAGAVAGSVGRSLPLLAEAGARQRKRVAIDVHTALWVTQICLAKSTF